MAELAFIKTHNGLLPADPTTVDYLKSMPLSKVLTGKFVRPRNPQFHRKFFAMLNIGYDMWNPQPIEYPKGSGNHITPEKDFDEFRKMMLVKAGFYKVIGYPDGSVRLRAKSVSFSNMDEDKFSDVYSAVLDQVLSLCCLDWPRKEYENAVSQVLEFA